MLGHSLWPRMPIPQYLVGFVNFVKENIRVRSLGRLFRAADLLFCL